jgi:hypothetical protein
VRPDGGGRRTANATLELSNNGPAGMARFNFNNPSTKMRFTSTDVITYDLTPSGDGWRVDFTVVGTTADNQGVILTGYAMDGGPAGSGNDSMSITVRTATGTVLFTGTGSVSEGDVVIVR